MGFEVDTQQVGAQAIQVLKETLPGRKYSNVTAAQYGEDLNAFLKTLVEMRDFLMSYASKVRITADPEAHLIIGEQIAIQADGAAPLKEGGLLTDENVVIEITAVSGGTAEGMIIRGEIAPSMESLKQTGYRVFSDGQIARPIGEVEVENERYRLAYAIDESLRLLEELKSSQSKRRMRWTTLMRSSIHSRKPCPALKCRRCRCASSTRGSPEEEVHQANSS